MLYSFIKQRRNKFIINYYNKHDLQSIEYWRYNRREGLSIERRQNEMCINQWRRGKRHGFRVTYINNDINQIVNIYHYLYGIRYGLVMKYHNNTPSQIEYYSNNKLHGAQLSYRNNKFDSLINYHHGKKHGKYITYHRRGYMISSIINYSHGQQHGPSISYHNKKRYITYWYQGVSYSYMSWQYLLNKLGTFLNYIKSFY